MASLKLSHIYKVYDNGHKAVNDFSIDIADKEFIVFVGPSGCGKSTTLRMIAGLETITAGDLFIGDTLVNDMEPKDRDIAMVFQSYALYPHMTVYENMAFGLRNRHLPESEIKEKVMEAAKMLDIEEYLDRKPKAMSGGQRQRVALGRALVRDPKVFLLDEPLSNLDAKLRAQMRTEITKLHKKLQTTFIYVTHDQVEAMTMGTRIVVMKLGYVQQIDTPMNLYNEPYNKFVAGFIGTPQMNFFNVRLDRIGDNVVVTFANDSKITLPYERLSKIHDDYLHGNKEVIFGIRPEHLILSEDGLECVITNVEHLGNECIAYGELGGEEQVFSLKDEGNKIIIKVVEGTNINVGDKVRISPLIDKVHFFDAESEITLLSKIPNYSKFSAKVSNGKLSFLSKEVDAPAQFVRICDNKLLDIEVPPTSVVRGNTYTLKVKKVEKIDGKNLAYLEFGDRYLFALVDDTVKENDLYSFDILFDKVKVTCDGEVCLDVIKEEISLLGTFDKDEIREVDTDETSPSFNKKVRKYYFYAVVGNTKFPLLTESGYKMNTIEGNNCYKRTYKYVVNMNDVEIVDSESGGLKVSVVDILDYGINKYALVKADEQEFLIKNNDYNIGDDLFINIPGDKISIYSTNIDMKIC